MGLYSNTPRSLDYRRSGVQDWARKKTSAQRTGPPLQPQLAIEDVEAGAKLGEGRGREAFGEDVRKL
jgi:hypothetical protein